MKKAKRANSSFTPPKKSVGADLKKIKNKKKLDSGKRVFPIVGIGASAGGLEAFLQLFKLLPPDTGMAFVLVQHLSPTHLSMLSAIVQKSTRMRVQEVKDGIRAQPNNVYVIPPDAALEIYHGVLYLRPLSLPRTSSHLVDTFFRSLARDQGNLAVGIVLSGTGSDGSEGLREIKVEGGISLVQDPKTAKYDGMPKMAIAIDHPDRVLPIHGLVKELVKIATGPHIPKILATEEVRPNPREENDLKKIFALIRSSVGTDFSIYKYPTIIRRMKRRMLLNRIEDLKHYLSFLRHSPAEVKTLFADLLINVTEFFRDPDTFEALKTDVFPELIKGRPEGSTIRVWVPGCSSGEEVYSLAISFLEYLGDASSKFPIQIYGTDISESAIKKARAGLYPETITKQVSEERLKRFFASDGDGYRISRAVRDCCIFSTQDVTADPPIHRLDLVSCRNLMIYLGSKIQKKVLETFFYALNGNGFLLLGGSESVGSAASLFSIVNDKGRIYRKRTSISLPAKSQTQAFTPPPTLDTRPASSAETPAEGFSGTDPVSMAENLVLEKYAPAWILVNQAMEIIHFKGDTENFIAPRSGQPSWNLIKMLREELVLDVRILLHACEAERKPMRKKGLKFKVGQEAHEVEIEARTLLPMGVDPHFLILFFETPVAGKAREKRTRHEPGEVKNLKEELAAAQRSLRTFLEEQNSTNEELQSANEEVLSANEELQSTNEELETAKEELQSTNEELVTLNEELSNRNSELSLVNDDLLNFLANVPVAIVMLNADLQIRRMTPAAEKLLNLKPTDLGRNLLDFNLGFRMDQIKEKLAEVIQNVASVEMEAKDAKERSYLIRMRPYKTTDRRIEGAVLTFFEQEEKGT